MSGGIESKEDQYLPVADAKEMQKIVGSLRRVATAGENDNVLTDEDKQNIEKFPLLTGRQLEVHHKGKVDRCIILGAPEGNDTNSWTIPVRLKTGERTNYPLYGLGILHTGYSQSPNRTIVRITEEVLLSDQ